MTAVLEHPGHRAPRSTSRRLWEPWALAALLVGTAIAYIWGLGASGWANSFYSAAVQAGSVSWEAFFFGSSDAANSITVDKPPASLWLMALSARIFGFSSWSMLVPQALLGVASVATLYATVKRSFGASAGLLAGLVLALTPIAALMFRFNNPDALLVALMIAAVWATLRAVEDGRTRWMVLTGVFVGVGFLTKQLQVMLVVPPLALTYLYAGPPKFGKRLAQCFAALGAMIVSAGWWLLAVELWPSTSRPWIGGSQNNSILELTLGYNGLGRLNGEETGSVVPGGGDMPGGMPGGGGSMWGSTGITRIFESAQGGQIAWLIPAALILLVAGIALRGKVTRTDPKRAAFTVWGLWLVITGLTFSFMAGIFHAYYTVALAPAVAALVGMGAVSLWRRRELIWVRATMSVVVVATAVTAWVLLDRTPDFAPWVKWLVVVTAAVAAVGVWVRSRGTVTAVVAGAAIVSALAGPAAYAADTVATPHMGSIVSAGPEVAGGFGGPGGAHPGGRPGAVGPDGGPGGPGGPDGAQMPDGGPGMAGRAGGGLLSGSTPGDAIVTLLESNADEYTWVAAAVGSNSASGYQLATGEPVMPLGGFNGSDPSPTLEQFQQYVTDGEIHYFVSGGSGGGGGMGSDGTTSQISTWVQENFTAVTVDGVTVYDLTT